MSLTEKCIGFIGGGAMAEALAGGLLASGQAADQLTVSDVDPERRKHLQEELGVRAVADNAEAGEDADVVVLAVKPDLVDTVLAGLGGTPDRARSCS